MSKHAATLQVRIESLDHEGRGVGHREGKAVFVEDALPGETVFYRLTRNKPNFETGIAEPPAQTSAERVTPGCKFFGLCGGCALQHASMGLQVAAKQRVLEDNLVHIGKLGIPQMLAPIRGPAWGYRQRARLSVHYVAKKGGVLVGFRERKSSYVADMAACEVLPPAMGQLITPLRVMLTRLASRERIPQIEVAIGHAVTVLVLRVLEPLAESDLPILRAFADTHGIQWWQQSKGPDTAVPWYPLTSPALTYRLPEYQIEVGFRPTEFTQVNHAVNRQMVKRAMQLLDPRPGESVVDWFCGLGNFSLPIARLGAEVVGVEGSAQLVARAVENAQHNGLEARARFVAADLYGEPGDITARLAATSPKASKWLIDPPRYGAVERCKQVNAEQVSRIVYVSCNPATLARDAAILVHTKGYRMRAAGIINMFPHTAHVESIAVFER